MTGLAATGLHVNGVGFAGSGIASWADARAVLRGEKPYSPGPLQHAMPDVLPAAERRRAGAVVRLAIAVAQEASANAKADPRELASVFASSDGDGENVHHICEALATAAPEISPTRFHNSVQNAASGYWSIATRSHAPSNTVNGLDTVFALGLLEAALQASAEERDVLLVAYDLPMPEPLLALRPLGASCGAALVLSPQASDRALARLRIAVVPTAEAAPMAMDDAAIEQLRSSNPAARALPLLRLIARHAAGRLDLPLDAALALRLEVEPIGASRA
jgi:hypothetical protein